jgi:hypothetical protein
MDWFSVARFDDKVAFSRRSRMNGENDKVSRRHALRDNCCGLMAKRCRATTKSRLYQVTEFLHLSASIPVLAATKISEQQFRPMLCSFSPASRKLSQRLSKMPHGNSAKLREINSGLRGRT